MTNNPDLSALSDLSAERRAIDAILGLPAAKTEEMRRLLMEDDFAVPSYQALWEAACHTIATGSKGHATVMGRLKDRGALGLLGDEDHAIRELADHFMAGASLNNAEVLSIAARVSVKSSARRVYMAAEQAKADLLRGEDPGEVTEAAIGSLLASRVAMAMPSQVDPTRQINRMEMPRADTVVPGLFRRGHRVVIVGLEGSGKTWLIRQITELAAQGVHPFHQGMHFDPIRTLTVDLENPLESVKATLSRISPTLERTPGYDEDRAWMWRQPQGIDIRTAKGYGELTAVIRHCKPDLVAIGPAYHMARKLRNEDDETYATSTLNVLSDLRTLFGFALILEHHAPHGDSAHREIRPFGSSAWLRWPEIGIAMRPDGPEHDKNSAMKLGRWRGDRVDNAWPERIIRVRHGYRPWVPDTGRPTIDDEMAGWAR